MKDFNLVVKTMLFELCGAEICLWSVWLVSQPPKEQLTLQCRHMLLASDLGSAASLCTQ